MEIKEMKDILVKSAQSNRSQYVPWWEGDFDNFTYKYEVFSAEEIHNMEECAAGCQKADLEEAIGSYGFTLFHLLVWHNLYQAVEKILAEGRCDVDLTDSKQKGITPLLLSCFCGNLAMARLLVAHGADTSRCDAEGNNGYHYLAGARIEGLTLPFHCQENTTGQRPEIAKLLTADINGKNADGFPALVLLLERQNADYSCALIDIFLEKGAETDYTDEMGNTLLLQAIEHHHMTAALRLMKCGNMIHQENNEGISPLRLARNYCLEGLSIILQDNGATLPDEIIRIDVKNLSRITANSFINHSSGKQDTVELALALSKKLINMIDEDDVDELKCILDILNNALMDDENCRILDICMDAGIAFTAPMHSCSTITCLRDQCLSGNSGVKAIRKLIALGVDMESAVIEGRTPVNIIASKPERKMLFDNKKDTYFEDAAQFFSKESMEQVDNDGTTALHYAARYNHLEMLRVMIEKGVDVNLTEDAPAEAGNTPLHTACLHGNAEIVKLLIASGADDTLQNVNGEIPAHLAVSKKRFGGELERKQRVALLKELKTLDGARNDGKTPLMILLQELDINTCLELLPFFLERGVDINRRDNRGNTALLCNASTLNQCFKEIVKELVRAGADVNIANNEGNTALHYILRYSTQDIARFLVKKGADYNHANLKGVTPAQIAVEQGYDTVLELMTDIQM